jgi:multidrug efflux pump subunit AcrB
MVKLIVKGLVAIIILCLIWSWYVSYFLVPVVTDLVREYNKPDTIITVHNGIADTTITIKK